MNGPVWFAIWLAWNGADVFVEYANPSLPKPIISPVRVRCNPNRIATFPAEFDDGIQWQLGTKESPVSQYPDDNQACEIQCLK